MDCNSHDHYKGECLVVNWEGANVRYSPEAEKERAEMQKRVEANHAKWIIGEHKRLEKENTSPF
mgnify:CR=1 FL=1